MNNHPDPTRVLIGLLGEAERLETRVADYEFHRQHSSDEEQLDDTRIEFELELRQPLADVIEKLHQQTAFLLESRGVPQFLQRFHRQFGTTVNGYKLAHEFDSDYMSHPQLKNVFLTKLRKFLVPLVDLDQLGAPDGQRYLERLLKSTAALLNHRGIIPEGEAEIYREVASVVRLLFPSATNASSRFFKTAKGYKPDILIPELSTAVEYKLIDSEAKLKTSFGAIADDVHGYADDPDYKFFYAVFYQAQDFWGLERCSVAWSDYKFPENWKAIFVVGPFSRRSTSATTI